jgi:hypothetical protein
MKSIIGFSPSSSVLLQLGHWPVMDRLAAILRDAARSARLLRMRVEQAAPSDLILRSVA